MQTTRLFVGIPIQQETKNIFYQLHIKNKNIEGIRWVPDNNLHITTYFLGDIENNKISVKNYNKSHYCQSDFFV